MARATRTIDTRGLNALDRQRADLAERELALLSREATLSARERDIAQAREDLVRDRNDLFDERQRLVDLRRRISDQTSKLTRKQRAITTGQEVRKRERAELQAERRELDAARKALDTARLQLAYDRAVLDGEEPEPVQVSLIPDLMPAELYALNRLLRDMRDWDEGETAIDTADILNCVARITEQGQTRFARLKAIHAMWRVAS